jgi:hypothetical protein
MMHYHPDIVLMMFRSEKSSAKITLPSLEAFDAGLHVANDAGLVKACEDAGVEPNKYNRSRVLGLAVLALGGAGKVRAAATAYKQALDEGIIG